MSEAPLRVAIVGQGPKRTFAVERLLDRGAALAAGPHVEVDLFEPRRAPGAGPVLSPRPARLSAHELPRQADRHVVNGSETVPASQRLPFTAWAREMGDGVEEEELSATRARGPVSG